MGNKLLDVALGAEKMKGVMGELGLGESGG